MKSCLALTLGIWGALLSPSAPGQTGGGDPYQALVKREFGTASNEMAVIEKEIQDAQPNQYPQIETRLLAVVEAPAATLPGKQFACQMLRTIGSARCVPAVSQLLTDEKLSHIARQVFLGMHDRSVEEAMRKALGKTAGNLRIGIINTIGDRGDHSSLDAISALLKTDDEPTTRSALNAIGKIGGSQAADALVRAKVAPPLREAWAHAYLRCAGSLAAAGESNRAEKMFQSLFDGDYPLAIRAAAFPAIAQMQKSRAAPLIIKTLLSKEAIMRRAAISAVITVPGNGATKAFVQALPGLTAETQIALLGALAIRGDAEGATDSINKLASGSDMAVREAAIKALARLGNAASVPVLVAALPEGGSIGSEAGKTLGELQARGVTEELIKQSEGGQAVAREAVLKVLAERGQPEALPVFRKAVTDPDPKIRQAGLNTLAALGTQEDSARLIDLLLASKDDSERELITRAIADIAGRNTDPAVRCEPVLQAIAKADAPAKASLLAVLSKLGGSQALQAVRTSLGGDPTVRKAAVRALSEWPDAAPMVDLLNVARDGKEKSEQILALRGYIRLAGSTGGQARLESYREAMELATRPEEKWLVLAGLAEVGQLDSLKLVESSLSDSGLKREAFAAYEKIAESLAGRQPAVARVALQRVLEEASETGVRNKAKTALEKIKN